MHIRHLAARRRYYDAEVGRWLTPDPKGYDDGPNLYAYVHNNPLTLFDHYGLYSEDDDRFFDSSEYDCLDCNDLDAFLARAYGPLAYSAACGCAKGALDFVISTLHGLESQITHIGTQSLELSCDWSCYIHQAVRQEQQERCAVVDRWVMDVLQIEQDDAVYHNCCYATTVGMEAGMLVSAGYGVCRGAYGLYRGARSLAAVETLSVEAATMECRSMSCLADNIICTENSLLAEQIANGHAFEKHIVKGMEYGQSIVTQEQFAAHIEHVLNNPTLMKELKRGRAGYWYEETETIVIRDPNHRDGGTTFKSFTGVNRYHSLD